MRRNQGERGQVVIMLLVAMGIFIFGAIGLAIDGAHLYAQRQLAQAAADAVAQAAIMSIFDHTNTNSPSKSTDFTATPLSSFTCANGDLRTPCAYARMNGFGTTKDTVVMDFPDSSVVPGVNLSGSDPTNLARATVTRAVDTTLMRFLGPTSSSVRAVGIAAITNVVSPVPIIITHPNLAGALSMNGNTEIEICGGPARSIQVNSRAANAVNAANIDLSHAGPADGGQCTTGTGADFGVFGGPATAPGSISLGTTGHYLQPASPIQDPLAQVPDPAVPANHPAAVHVNNGQFGCTQSSGCQLYSPGLYDGGLDPGHSDAVFKPGLYYVRNGDFHLKNTTANMCPPGVCALDPAHPEINNGGMVVYHTGTGSFQIDTNVSNTRLVGAPIDSIWKGILFFQDRSSGPGIRSHGLGQGNGCFDLVGTIYITNTLAIMTNTPGTYQSVTYNGNPCTSTINQGEIIVSKLSLVGTSELNMWLFPTGFLNIRQVALVK